MSKPSIKKQKKKKKTDWWDGIWLQESILKQLNFLRRIIFLYLEVTGLLSKFINKYQKKDERYSLIELGCGGSSYLPYLAKKYNNLQLFGMDKSLMGCKLAVIGIDGGISKVNVFQGDVLQCPLKSGNFDIVFSLGLIEHFDEPAIREAGIGQIIDRIAVTADPELDKQGHHAAVVRVRTKMGSTYEKTVRSPHGGPASPLTRDEHIERFNNCFSYAGKPLPRENRETIITHVSQLEDLRDVRGLIPLLVS